MKKLLVLLFLMTTPLFAKIEVKDFANKIDYSKVNRFLSVGGMVNLNPKDKRWGSKLFLKVSCLLDYKQCFVTWSRIWNDGGMTMDSAHKTKYSYNEFDNSYSILLIGQPGCKLVYLNVDMTNLRIYHITKYNPNNRNKKYCKKQVTKTYKYELTGLLKGKEFDYLQWERKEKKGK